MSMSVGSGGSDEPMMDINTTPLIDVMLVLIITLIMSIPPQTQNKGIIKSKTRGKKCRK